MPFKVPVENPALNVTYEFGLMGERNGWFMEVSIDDDFLFLVQMDSERRLSIDFCWEVHGSRYKELLKIDDLADIISSAKRCYFAHDASHFNVI